MDQFFLLVRSVMLCSVIPSVCSTLNILPTLIYPSNVRTDDLVSPKRQRLFNKLYSSMLQNTLT